MSNHAPTLIDVITSAASGMSTTLLGALMGRLMWHVNEARHNKRGYLGKELLWEIPLVVGMWMVGEAVVEYAGLNSRVADGAVVMIAYLGPRWFEVTITRIVGKKIDDDKL